MTKILELFLGHSVDDATAKRDAFTIGAARLMDSTPRLGRDALSVADLLVVPDADSEADDWVDAERDLGATVEAHRPK